MHRWQVGAVEVVRVEDDDFPIPSDVAVPGWAVPHLAPDTGSYHVAFSAYGIADGDRRIVVDPWLANDFPRDLPDAPERAARLLGVLADAGFDPEVVDTVVNTHIDGIGWNTRPGDDGWVPSFPNARYLLARAELEAYHRSDPLFEASDLSPVLDAGLLDPVDPPVALTDAVSLVPAPGHNFGHVTVRIESDGDLTMIPGHLFTSVLSVVDHTPLEGEGPESRDSREEVLAELADRGGLLLSPLFGGAGGGRVERAGDGYHLVSA
jgi:glyoxylase-like metal-dependent hydrolase (beta-lactamase superfamily II)